MNEILNQKITFKNWKYETRKFQRTKQQAEARAKREGFPLTQVVQADDGGYFIAPHGITKESAKKAYANCRAKGNEAAICAAMAHRLQNE